jgi:hypothetical protein
MQWPGNTPSENSSISKTNTTTNVKISENPKFEKNQSNIKGIMNFYISKFYKDVCWLATCRNSKNSYFINIKPIYLKLWNFTNLNIVFPVLVLVFDFNESSEGVLHGH